MSAELPVISLTQSEFDALPNFIRKKDGRADRTGDRCKYHLNGQGDDVWYIGEFYDTPELIEIGKLGIRWHSVDIRPDGIPFRGRVGTYELK